MKNHTAPTDGGIERRAIAQIARDGFSVELTPSEMRQLEKVVHAATDKFNVLASTNLKALRELIASAQEGKTPAETIIKRVAREALDLKGLGGTFDYPLVTRIAKSLNDYTTDLSKIGKRQIEVVALHVDALYVILAQRITGTGSETEWQVLEALGQATRKFKT